ncbi:RNA polymerase sigma factor [Sporosarcina thermotolerans]|uniref:RNA polymerase sigma factor n=1 Tax=Sporosarcina thermotolerans TaxID=633404 RepID=A0AAW9AC56_9BACL|nr:RNA polymerase sigma factor [Sporosarcina thermotolerans]MDW0116673.1 RNA polymerase sigma factor [Sporosarcina thermotolerans]WHT48870.1 RNA polymerase sigma factor [Sporosarcina thermotolerans]
MNEREISEKAIGGDDEAFLSLMQIHKEALLRTAIAFLKNEQDSLEALQEVTYRAYKKIHTVREPAYVKTWLIRIMMNYCQDQLKRGKRYVMTDKVDETTGKEDDYRLELAEALATLKPDEQQLIYLKYFQDVKIKEIAEISSIPEGTVKSRLHKILRSLRAHFGDKGGMDHV